MTEQFAFTWPMHQLDAQDRYIFLSDAHIYTDQLPWVDEILSRKSHPFPTLKLVNRHDSIKDYRPDDFELTDYTAEPAIKGIPTAI